MDTNWIEYLLPIIFFVLYGISKIFGKGDNKEVDAPASPPVDIGEQQRRIQEEIRRRIAERRAEATPAQSTQTLKPEPPKIDRLAPPRAPYREPELDVPQVAQQKMPDPAVLDMQQQLAAQMEHLREANKKSDSLSQSIRRVAKKNDFAIATKRVNRSHFRNEITSMLNDAQSAKKAFLYSEIFGVPMGQRKQSVFAPLIDQ